MVSSVMASGLAQEPQTPNDFPDFDEAELAARMRLKLTTIRAWRCRHPEKLPPGTKVGRNWLYDKNVVEEWLAARREGEVKIKTRSVAPQQTVTHAPGKGRRGRPRKNPIGAMQQVGGA